MWHAGFLVAAIGLEVAGTACMKLSHGFERLVPSALMLVFYVLSLGALTMAVEKFPVGAVYAIWSGVGTALICVIGAVVFREPLSMAKVACLALIIVGVVGLHVSGGLEEGRVALSSASAEGAETDELP